MTRQLETETGWREAVYSDCARYRYSLTAVWDADRRRLVYVMLNPSKATELANDPTIERCERRARALGYGAFRAVNLFGLRETSPARLKAAKRPVGAENIEHIQEAVLWADDVLAAWGVHGAHLGQEALVLDWLEEMGTSLLCLGCTQAGAPRHPLYVPYAKTPERFARHRSHATG